jgi:predicted TIM-barrel fold metal-dependent hydrolase
VIVDMHANISPFDAEYFARLRARGVPGDPEACQVEHTLRRMDENDIAVSVVWRAGRDDQECRRNNDFVAAERDKRPDRLIGFATVDPKNPDAALAELGRAIDDLGLVGIKIHPKVMGISLDDPRFVAVMREVAARGLPFVTHVNTTRAQQLPTADASTVPDPIDANVPSPLSAAKGLAPLIEVYDDARFQSAHMGGVLLPWIQQSRISFQTAGASVDVIEWAIRTIGLERVVFGSDFPFFLVEDEIAKVRALPLAEADQERVLSGNALDRVLRIGPVTDTRPVWSPDVLQPT